MQKPLSQTQQPSLEAPPVYRRFLGGGADVLRLSAFDVAVIVGFGIFVAVLSRVAAEARPPWEVVSAAAAATIAAVSTAAIAARWLGSRVGLFSGCLYIASGQNFLVTPPPGDLWLAAIATTAVAVFATANVAGRQPPSADRLSARVFYLLIAAMLFFCGPAAATAVAVICILTLATAQNCRGLRFFVDPAGISLLAVVAIAVFFMAGPGRGFDLHAVWSAAWTDERIASIEARSETFARFSHLIAVRIPFDALPWSPLAVVAVVAGIRQGYHSVAFGRFLAIWLLVPLGLVLVSMLHENTAAALVLPPLAILGGIGLSGLLVKIFRLRGERHRSNV